MMNDPLVFAFTLLAALGSAAIGGLFFAFSVCVMTALGRLPAHQGMAAMQAINVAILNPLFFAAFFGTAAICAALILLSLADWNPSHSAYLTAGGALYLVGGILVTMVFNVPLNRALGTASGTEGAQDAELWRRYLSVWTAWNHARLVCCLCAAGLFILTLY